MTAKRTSKQRPGATGRRRQQRLDMPRLRPAKCLRDANTGKPIMLPVVKKKKRYGMTTIFGIRTRDRDWGKAGRESARRLMKALGVKQHTFILEVRNASSRRSAELAVLTAFACRKPDGCEFYLKRHISRI